MEVGAGHGAHFQLVKARASTGQCLTDNNYQISKHEN
jgi:hypothetical protein